MMKWSTDLSKTIVGKVQECTVTNVFDNEDFTTDQLVVSVDKSTNRLFVRGFRTDKVTPNPNSPDVHMVEVWNGFARGVVPDDDILLNIHKKVKDAFGSYGYKVVDNLEIYI